MLMGGRLCWNLMLWLINRVGREKEGKGVGG